ncbi:hypothetical protein KY345_05475 [Candidatus Woesearchaeota archaeon]|nr:hypothetical protein [Candidatus Woesearchaeota archaeon]
MVVKAIWNFLKKLSFLGVVYGGYQIGKGLGYVAGGIMEENCLDDKIIQMAVYVPPWITAMLTAKYSRKYVPILREKEFSMASEFIETATEVGVAASLMAPFVNAPDLCDKINEVLPETYHIPIENLGGQALAGVDFIRSNSGLVDILEGGIEAKTPLVDIPYTFSTSPNLREANIAGLSFMGAGAVGYLKNHFKGNFWGKIASDYEGLKKKLSFDKEHWKQYGKDTALKGGALLSCGLAAVSAYYLGSMAIDGLHQYGANVEGGFGRWMIDSIYNVGGAVRNIGTAFGFYAMNKGWEKWRPVDYKNKLGYLGTMANYAVMITLGYNGLRILESINFFGWRPFNVYGLVDWISQDRSGVPLVTELVDWLGSGEYGHVGLMGFDVTNPNFWLNTLKGIGRFINWGLYHIPGIGDGLNAAKENWHWNGLFNAGYITKGLVNPNNPEGSLATINLALSTMYAAMKKGSFDAVKDDINKLKEGYADLSERVRSIGRPS